MIGRSRPRRLRIGRPAIIVFAAVVVIATAYGPADIASAFGMHRLPPAPADPMGYVPEPLPVVVKAPTARLVNLQKVVANDPIRLSDGSMSPADTVYLRFTEVQLDKLSITQARPGLNFSIDNAGSDKDAAVVGNLGSVTEMWAVVHQLALCVTAQTLDTVAITYAGVFGGDLDPLLALIAQVLAPVANSPFGPVGPCLPLKSLFPVLQVFIDHGVPLPATLPAADLDADVYSLKVTTKYGTPSVTLPQALVEATR